MLAILPNRTLIQQRLNSYNSYLNGEVRSFRFSEQGSGEMGKWGSGET